MDRLARLIVVVALVLGASGAWAFGEVSKKSQFVFTCSGSQGTSAEQACTPGMTAFASGWVMTPPLTKYWKDELNCGNTTGASTSGWCSRMLWVDGRGNTPYSGSWSRSTVVGCPPGSAQTLSGKCECVMGSKAVLGECQLYTCPAKGAYSSVTQPDIEVSNVGSQCLDGCTVDPGSVKAGTDGKLWATWPYVNTGQACGGKDIAGTDVDSGQTKISDPPLPCGANMCPGSVNGASVCVACKDTTIKGPSSTASAPAGQQPQIPGAPAGSVSEEKSSSCTQSSCTTTTVYRDASGAETGRKSEEKGKESFCTENPDAAICKKGSWGGGCGAFSCDGDPVQCALALRVHKSACDWEQVDEGLKSIGTAAIAGESRPAGHPFANPETGSVTFSSVIDQTNRLGGGCPADVAISYGGRSWVIPWSQHCDKLQLIGNLMVGVCMLAAAMIVFRS